MYRVNKACCLCIAIVIICVMMLTFKIESKVFILSNPFIKNSIHVSTQYNNQSNRIGYITNCLSNEILVSYQLDTDIENLNLYNVESLNKETDKSRRDNFFNIFKAKKWGTKPKEGMLASGTAIFFILICCFLIVSHLICCYIHLN